MTTKLISIITILMFLFMGTSVFAVPPATPYNPSETLDPICGPTDVNCFVDIPAGGADVTTASNGLTESSDDVQLGGTLTQDTSIDTGAFTFTLGDAVTGDRSLIFDDDFFDPGNGAMGFLYNDNATNDVSFIGSLFNPVQGLDVVGSIALTDPDGAGPFPASFSTVDESNVTSRSFNASGTVIADVIVNGPAGGAALTVTGGGDQLVASNTVSSDRLNSYINFNSGNSASFGIESPGVNGHERVLFGLTEGASSTVDLFILEQDEFTFYLDNDPTSVLPEFGSMSFDKSSFQVDYDNSLNLLEFQDTGEFQVQGVGQTGNNVSLVLNESLFATSGGGNFDLDVTENDFSVAGDGGSEYNLSIDGAGFTFSNLASNAFSVGVSGLNVHNLTGGATTLEVDASGNIIRTPSDKTLKTDVDSIENALDKVNNLNPVSYSWIDQDRFGTERKIGFLAQEVQKVVPEVVSDGGEYVSLNYGNLTALNAAAIQELDLKFDEIEALADFDDGDEKGLTKFIKNLVGKMQDTIARFQRVETEEVCIGDTCVDEQTLKNILEDNISDGEKPNSEEQEDESRQDQEEGEVEEEQDESENESEELDEESEDQEETEEVSEEQGVDGQEDQSVQDQEGNEAESDEEQDDFENESEELNEEGEDQEETEE